MTTILNLTGLILNITGTVILAFSLSAYIQSMRLAIDGHELFIMSYFSTKKPMIQVTGTDVHMERDRKKAGIYSWVGVFLVLLGFVFQISSYFIKN